MSWLSPENTTPESWASEAGLINWTGLAEMVGQSEAADTGESDREVAELVSDKRGETFLWSGAIVLTRLALFVTTLAVLMTGEWRAMTGVAETR